MALEMETLNFIFLSSISPLFYYFRAGRIWENVLLLHFTSAHIITFGDL
jgi:hypothetical protein